jgi:hypothetical protein
MITACRNKDNDYDDDYYKNGKKNINEKPYIKEKNTKNNTNVIDDRIDSKNLFSGIDTSTTLSKEHYLKNSENTIYLMNSKSNNEHSEIKSFEINTLIEYTNSTGSSHLSRSSKNIIDDCEFTFSPLKSTQSELETSLFPSIDYTQFDPASANYISLYPISTIP